MKLENGETFALPDSLIVPISAKSVEAIQTYVGPIIERASDNRWLFVEFSPLAPPEDTLVWKEPKASWIHASRQCWVHVDHGAYRQAYQRCYPGIDLTGFVIDHVQNRRFARKLGFLYVRLMHVHQGVNSSSGRGEEYDVINYNNPMGLDAERFKESPHQITYADPADLLKMLNIKVGAFPLDNLRDHLHLFYGKKFPHEQNSKQDRS